MAVMLRLHGQAHICLPNRAEPIVLDRISAKLLAVLAAEERVARDRVMALVWPESKARDGTSSLRNKRSRLRSLVGSELIVGDSVLSLAPFVTHDLQEHVETPEAGDVCMPPDLLANIRPLAGTEFGNWLLSQREIRRSAVRAAWERRLQALEQDQLLDAAIRLAEQIVLLVPNAEQSYRKVAQLHWRRGVLAPTED
jgi:DNA-binding SARP family transcriptional activator